MILQKNNSFSCQTAAVLAACLAVSFIIVACSTGTTAVKSAGKRPTGALELESLLEKRGTALVGLKAEGNITVDVAGRVQKGQFAGALYKRDSLMLTVYGPFNIVAYKIASTPDFMNFYDVLSGTLYQGAPTPKNFQTRLGVPLSHADIASFLRGEIPDGFIGFKEQAPTNDSEQVYVRQRDTLTERVTYSFIEESFVHYERKGAGGGTIIDAKYSNFTASNAIRLPQDAFVSFPQINATFSVQCRSLEVNPKDQRYGFTPPMEARRKRL